MPSRIRLRRGLAADWTSENPVLTAGEAGFETNTNKLKVGNGTDDWVTLPYFGGATAINDLSDVVITTASNGQLLSFNGTNWVNSTPAAVAINDLSDVVITTPSTGQLLSFNGTNWVNSAPAGAGDSIAVELTDGASVNVNIASGEYFYITRAGNVNFVFVPPAPGVAGRVLAFTLEINSTGTGIAEFVGNTIRWVGGNPPTLTASGKDILEFVSRDDGATWNGFVAGLDIKTPV